MKLPAPLEPWRDWLSLFPPELAEPLGVLLLRLHPAVGRMNTAALRTNDDLAGIGNIVRRGPYERMLMTEWAYADAEPDEFIRRAAGGELLFTGPEPDIRLRSRRCVALFDAGSSQLGEPRLAHMALFILLARRAEEAGAQFQWGVLQQPGVFHTDTAQRGMQTLLSARTLQLVSAADVAAWDVALDPAENEIFDCWQLSGADAPLVKKAKSKVFTYRELFAERLSVTVRQSNTERQVALDLPDSAVGVRMLREPFAPVAHLGRIRQKSGRPSLKQAPRFSVCGSWLAVAQLDGGCRIFHVPDSPKQTPGKVRTLAAPGNGNVLAAGVFKKNLSYVLTGSDGLTFVGFPGQLYSSQRAVCPRPEIAQFHAPVGMARWLPAYFLNTPKYTAQSERVVLIDIDRQMVAWEYAVQKTVSNRGNAIAGATQHAPAFKQIATEVIGAEQFHKELIYGRLEHTGVRIYRWRAHELSPTFMDKLPHPGTRLLFGERNSWKGQHNGLLALQTSAAHWWISYGHETCVMEIQDGAYVAGVTRHHKGGLLQNGLIVLHPNKQSVQFRTKSDHYELIKSPVAIAQIAVEPGTGRIAWLTVTHELHVHNFDDNKPLLHVVADSDISDTAPVSLPDSGGPSGTSAA